MNQKQQQSIFHANVNVNLIERNVRQINGGIATNVDVSVKNFMYVKRLSLESSESICENDKYLASIMNDSIIQTL